MSTYEERIAALTPWRGDVAIYAPGTPLEARGTVLAVVASARWGYAFLVDWDEGSGRRGPEGFEPTVLVAGLVKTERA
jgi:hypothetical protein